MEVEVDPPDSERGERRGVGREGGADCNAPRPDEFSEPGESGTVTHRIQQTVAPLRVGSGHEPGCLRVGRIHHFLGSQGPQSR